MSKLLPVQYCLEIYCDGEGDKPIMTFASNTPFLGISKGDKIVTKTWEGLEYLGTIEVTGVEHLVWEAKESHIGHKIMVETKSCPKQ